MQTECPMLPARNRGLAGPHTSPAVSPAILRLFHSNPHPAIMIEDAADGMRNRLRAALAVPLAGVGNSGEGRGAGGRGVGVARIKGIK